MIILTSFKETTMSLLGEILNSKLVEIKYYPTISFSITYTLPDTRKYSVSICSNSDCRSFVYNLKRTQSIYEFRSITDSSYKHPFMQKIYKRVMDDINKFKQTQEYKNSLKEYARPSITSCLKLGVDPNELKKLVDEVFAQLPKETK